MQTGLANKIDHTLLKPNVTASQIHQLCAEAKEYRFASVCINPCYVSLAHELLRETDVKVCTVIGFPLGSSTTETKILEAKEAIQNGADELDYVVNLNDIANGRFDSVKREMQQFVHLRTASNKPIVVKMILETCYLTNQQIIEVCKLAKETGLDFVKTSTGFGSGGATVEHVRIMRETVGTGVGVKASGGIRSYDDCMAMINAGANRIGASASVAIVTKTTGDQQTTY